MRRKKKKSSAFVLLLGVKWNQKEKNSADLIKTETGPVQLHLPMQMNAEVFSKPN